jgi:hypothetical protein
MEEANESEIEIGTHSLVVRQRIGVVHPQLGWVADLEGHYGDGGCGKGNGNGLILHLLASGHTHRLCGGLS